MATKSRKLLPTYSLVFVCVAALAGAACGSIEPSPTAPSPVASPSPTPSPTPAPSGPGRLEVTINPNPVPWSGTPINEGGCTGVSNTWFYTQTLRNAGANAIVVSDRSDYFNNREVSKRTNLGITLAAGQDTNITTRWCSSSSGNQSAQTNWGATDTVTRNVVTVNGPVVTLRAR